MVPSEEAVGFRHFEDKIGGSRAHGSRSTWKFQMNYCGQMAAF